MLTEVEALLLEICLKKYCGQSQKRVDRDDTSLQNVVYYVTLPCTLQFQDLIGME